MNTYTVTAERSGKWWVLQAVEAPGAISQVTRLDQAEEIIEAIAFVTGEREEDISITVRPVLPPAVVEHLAHATQLRGEATAASVSATSEMTAAALTLQSSGLTVRDIGSILGVSFQRAHQLVTA